jgi:hypothetical protein
MFCKVSVFLAYGMAIYCLSSMYYVFQTRNVGTPFKDSLTKKQKIIKKESAEVRKNIFCQGIFASIILLALTKPFHKCS